MAEDRPSAGWADRFFDAYTELKKRRRVHDYTLDELGALIGAAVGRPPINNSTVDRWKKGTTPRDLDDIYAVAKALEVNPAWLAFGIGERSPAVAASNPRAAVRGQVGDVYDTGRTAPPPTHEPVKRREIPVARSTPVEEGRAAAKRPRRA